MLSTLEKANRLIGSADSKTLSALAAQSAFEDCQQTTIKVGAYLETKENTESIINNLEEYCEAIYQVSISLESIWMAVKDDSECDAYVVPIPYYDKNPDGSLREIHYEGSKYSDYVPIVDWQEYNLEERRPDVVYVHNSYDEYNYVTVMNLDYYARNLKQYTDMLVYIPYFVGINNQVEEHFCTLSGVLYADRVIVSRRRSKGSM